MIAKANYNVRSLLVYSGIAAFFLGIFCNNTIDWDLWGYLAFGRLFWETGAFPYQDVFSYTPTKPLWVYHEWLTGIIFFPIYKNFGAAGLQLLKYLLGMVTVGLVCVTAVRRKATPFFVFLALIVAGNLIKAGYSPVRAQVFTYLFFVLTLYLLDQARAGKHWKYLWWLVPVELLWCNLHGGFVVGLSMIGIYTVGEAVSGRKYYPYAAILLAAALITLVNPYGCEYWRYMAGAVLMPRPEIGEWQNVFATVFSDEYRSYGVQYTIVFLLSVPLVFWYPKRDLTTIIVLSATLIMGLLSIRNTVFFALAFAAFSPVIMKEFWEALKSDPKIIKRYSRFRMIGLMLIIVITSWTVGSSLFKFIVGSPLELRIYRVYYPVGAVEMIQKNNLKGNILPWFEWGEYLIWTLYPDNRVSMDGRYETVYRDSVSTEYFNFIFARDNWRDFLEKYPHDMILVRSDSKIRVLLAAEPDWCLAYDGKDGVLFLRREYCLQHRT
ncbi:MAG: hypothetical protein HPY65_12805 [Syntrophaceae bacterium]|nr:hypothetical protein [Syntrophaceae bacterium]